MTDAAVGAPIAIEVPKLNNNDASYILTEWLVGEGQEVGAGDPVAVIETSKAAEELCASAGGVLHHLLPQHADCAPGTVIGRLFSSEAERTAFVQAGKPSEAEAPGAATAPKAPVVTEPARALARRYGIDDATLADLGLRIVREADVRGLIGP